MWSVDSGDIVDQGEFTRGDNNYNGAQSYNWDWDRLGEVYLDAGQHTLHIWAGGSGFDLDRFIISTNNQSSGENLPSTVRNTWTHQDNNRTGAACDPCDARFGGSPYTDGQGGDPPFCQVTDDPADSVNARYLDDLFDDEQPIRGAVEAAKDFVGELNPEYDQVGFVPYSGRAKSGERVELQCLRSAAASGENCTDQVITDTVISALDNTHADGSTNIGEGIKSGIEVLSNLPGHFGRPSAAHIMVLMTDGEANRSDGLDTSKCTANLWPGDQHKDCVVYYAMLARNNGIVIYTITLGESADIELMQYVAELTGGVHRHAPRVEQLGPIFDELYQRIFLRLVE
jgi:hypothetical protein